MKERTGTTGLVFNEPLLWEMGRTGRSGMSPPPRDVEPAEVCEELQGKGPDFPDLSEPEVVRHYTRLSQWNFGVDSGMYPLGSCTMKYNPKTNERQAARKGFASAHPLLPDELSQGALRLMAELERCLAQITGMDAGTLQPAAGAQGELTGMLIIHRWFENRDDPRTKIIVPDTAHGTNPASAALCGFRALAARSGPHGILLPETIEELMDDETAGVMVTNPNTLGLFEENMEEISRIVHERGGLVYCDGANMNALMGLVDMASTGIDILHLNLHKTFSTPHGGGGPGSGPVMVRKELEPFLPVPRVVEDESGALRLSENHPLSIGKVHTFYGNFGVMVKALSYILSMGPNLKRASELAVLNANYIKELLKDTYQLPYDRTCMHECVFTDALQQSYGVTTLDISKRLMDYGFHPPTIYFPLVVKGALMIEPTETESKETIDTFIESMRSIAREAREEPDLLLNAPHYCKTERLDETGAARKPCLAG